VICVILQQSRTLFLRTDLAWTLVFSSLPVNWFDMQSKIIAATSALL